MIFSVHEIMHALRCDVPFLLKDKKDGTVYAAKLGAAGKKGCRIIRACQLTAKDNPMSAVLVHEDDVDTLCLPRLGDDYTEQDAVKMLLFYLSQLTPQIKWTFDGRKIVSDSPLSESFVFYHPSFSRNLTAVTFGFSKDYFRETLDESIKAAVLEFYDSLLCYQF